MIARIRHALQRARRIGYTRGYRAGIEDAACALPPELIAAYWTMRNAQEGNLVELRVTEKALADVLESLIEGEKIS